MEIACTEMVCDNCSYSFDIIILDDFYAQYFQLQCRKWQKFVCFFFNIFRDEDESEKIEIYFGFFSSSFIYFNFIQCIVATKSF